MMFRPTLHPILKIPTARQAAAMGEDRWRQAMTKREEIIHAEQEDPLRNGYEPEIWRVCDALFGFPNVDPAWAAKVREAMGFAKPIRVLLILGGNRGSKSEYAAKTCQRCLHTKARALVTAFHSTMPESVAQHQKLFWKYMAPEFRKLNGSKTDLTYIAYKQKTGFSDDKFVLPNGAEGAFKAYKMEREDALQSGEWDAFWDDELVPVDWIADQEMRIASRSGFGLVTFTPIRGYTPTVGLFLEGARTVLETVGFGMPKDGGDADWTRALGFGSDEERDAAWKEERWSVPARFELQSEGETWKIRETQPETPAGRVFETVPRIQRPVTEGYAVVYFHSRDNPYGKPNEVVHFIKHKDRVFIRERFYGIAHRTVAATFPKFSRDVHVLPRSAIPAQGTNYLFGDPAGGRNFVWKWYRVLQVGDRRKVYLYREWPGNYWIPGVGVPGPWALPDGKHPDGKRGPAQVGFGFGLIRYKEEIARLEGWEDAIRGGPEKKKQSAWRIEHGAGGEGHGAGEEKAGETDGGRFGIGGPDRTLHERQVTLWKPGKAREIIEERYLDSRAATTRKSGKSHPVTLLTDFEDIGLHFEETPGDDIAEGVAAINSALDYDEERPVDFFNSPEFYVCEDCVNSIYALLTWTGLDGNKGATKDFIDLDRYFFLSECDYIAPGQKLVTGGGTW